MIKYGSESFTHIQFSSFKMSIEIRDSQWIDITLVPELKEESELPTDLIDFSILVICNHAGMIAQIVPLDVGCDCEYQLIPLEKDQITQYIQSEAIQAQIAFAVEHDN